MIPFMEVLVSWGSSAVQATYMSLIL